MREWLKLIGSRNRSENIAQYWRRPQDQRTRLLCHATIGFVAICLLAGLAACGQAPQEASKKPKFPTTYTSLNGEYIKTATMTCGEATIKAVIRCKKEPTYPAGQPTDCSDQYFVFRRAGKETIVRPGKKLPREADPGGYYLLPRATDWLCTKGKDQHYIYVAFYQGGNCDTCEWSQIYDLSGRPMIDLIKNRRMDFEWPQIMEKRPIDGGAQNQESSRVRQRLGIIFTHGAFDDDSTIPIREND